jgi:hypothetical protein
MVAQVEWDLLGPWSTTCSWAPVDLWLGGLLRLPPTILLRCRCQLLAAVVATASASAGRDLWCGSH